MLLDSSEDIDKSYLGRKCVSMVDGWVAAWTIPAVNWCAVMHKHTATFCQQLLSLLHECFQAAQ